jgi:hypothetical protein
MSHPLASLLHIGFAVVAILTGEASLFHALVAFSLLTVLTGYAAEAAVRIPVARFWWAVAAASIVVLAVGGLLLNARLPGLRARYGSLAIRSRS